MTGEFWKGFFVRTIKELRTFYPCVVGDEVRVASTEQIFVAQAKDKKFVEDGITSIVGVDVHWLLKKQPYWDQFSDEEAAQLLLSAPCFARKWTTTDHAEPTDIRHERFDLTRDWSVGYIWLKVDYSAEKKSVVKPLVYVWNTVPTPKEPYALSVEGEADTLEEAQKACDERLRAFGWRLL